MIYVQFSDAGETEIISYFGGPQDDSVYLNQGFIETDDTRWKTYYDSFPPNMQDSLPPPTVA